MRKSIFKYLMIAGLGACMALPASAQTKEETDLNKWPKGSFAKGNR